jgi:hypothetical protein
MELMANYHIISMAIKTYVQDNSMNLDVFIQNSLEFRIIKIMTIQKNISLLGKG